MDSQSILRKYYGIADYIAAINGSTCEVIVHDISNLQSSIVHIANGHVTDREVGGTITDYALDLIIKQKNMQKDSIVNYMGSTSDGRILRSSTYFIRDDMHELIGLLCVNIDITDLIKARDILVNAAALNAEPVNESVSSGSREHFNLSVDELVNGVIDNAILESGISPDNSNTKQKKELTRMLFDRGVFKLKGAVNVLARRLNISSQSVYRYYKEIEGEGKE